MVAHIDMKVKLRSKRNSCTGAGIGTKLAFDSKSPGG